MAYWHCTECHHEWESVDGDPCDWCGCPGYILEDSTPLERFVKDFNRKKIKILSDILSARKEGRPP